MLKKSDCVNMKIVFVFVSFIIATMGYAQSSGGEIKRNAPQVNRPNHGVGKKSNTNRKAPKKNSSPASTRNNAKSFEENKEQVLENLISNMIFVEGGTFTMGATSEQGLYAYKSEKPTHLVTLSGFYIGKNEVTQEEWQIIMGSNPSQYKGSKRPVENVSWEDCQIFIRKLNETTGLCFRLPTEAEWEYAARGGKRSRGYKYAGSNNYEDVAWCYDHQGKTTTHPVGQLAPNELGLYDMSGNVDELCSDWWGTYSSETQYNPVGPSSGTEHVRRGGCWGSPACGVSWRTSSLPSICNSGTGFRLVR